MRAVTMAGLYDEDSARPRATRLLMNAGFIMSKSVKAGRICWLWIRARKWLRVCSKGIWCRGGRESSRMSERCAGYICKTGHGQQYILHVREDHGGNI